MTYQIFQLPKQTLIGSAAIKPSWKVSFFLTGTTTPTPVYTTSALSVAHTQPVQADSGGVLATIYLDPSIVYKASVYDQNDVLQYTVDPVNDSLVSQAVIGAALYPRTAAEIAAGVTPAAYYYPPGDVRRYGAAGDGSADDTAEIQAALDSSDVVYLPLGEFKVSSALLLNDNNFIIGAGRGSQITSTHNGAVIAGKSVTPSSGTNVRRYSGGGRDFMIYGPGTGSTSSIALDMRGCTMFKWWGLLIQNIATAVRQGDNYSTYYNEYHGVDISGYTTGYLNDTLANENLVIGGRCNDGVTGTSDSDNSHNKYIGLAIEVFTTGHLITGAATQEIQYLCSRLENIPTTGTGISINANAQDTQLLFPQMIGLTTNISNSGLRTNIWASEYFAIASGTRVKRHLSATATINFASIAAGAYSPDTLVTLTGATASSSVFATPPASIETGLTWVAIPATDGVYIRLHNGTAGAIDPASATWTVDAWNH